MRLRSLVLALAPLAFFGTSASAADIATAKELVTVCTVYAAKDENALRDPDPCRRFLVGFFTAYIAAENAQRDGMVQGLPATHGSACVRLPDSLSYREMAQRLVRYGNAHPNELAGTPNDLAQHTLETDFPCPPQQAPR